ncbi:aromatic hydrocarbon degradation protein [Enterovibrio norvegicus]|uniref:Outer membrane protein transport protein n=1 Tax=Enterovibrio norvegicus TaxID=188144 RepID=A0ABV4KW66_9GAMM|nr:outer membrane protein transport protein [Enterovibrio norvegicus]MCC4797829.1 outer membrane protein transport protein [Enterovibrio norvegicus]OEF58844.1 aromatic hydrocarbon degradation protein [Enterovibrio norvegicus]PMH65653.1 aromatic hydrocarbon degradation protein [Enterovibrio norvegicus]PMI32972.1 aromatic hydrocarbon degradation protein [Enterovibrio norvegicus]PMI33936.1 aromatic hydrocarbon degradation protein [Enterovibrio norvegicus]
MNKNKILPLAIAAALGSLSSTSAYAAGFQLAEYSATGLGRAYAGEAAMADNAAAQFRNPAMLTYLEGTQVSTGMIYVDPNVDVDGTNTSLLGKETATSSKDFADAAVVPNFYVSHQVNEQVFFGLALASNFGMNTKLDDNFKGTQFGNEASITTVEINPNVAYRINDQFSIGGGVRFVMGEGSIGAKSSGGLAPVGTPLKYMEGDDTSWGWQAGAAWQINESNRLGFNYRSAVDLKLEGHASGLSFGTTTGQLPGSMELGLPATAEIASFHQITEKVAVHASVNWTDWSEFEKLEANIPSLSEPTQMVKEENWRDNYRVAVGATYQLNDKTELRSGVAYDTSAVDDANRTITIPETDRLWLSLGAGYEWSKNLTLDAGFTYIFAKEAPVKEPRDHVASDQLGQLFGGSFEGKTSGSVWLAGVQASYRF